MNNTMSSKVVSLKSFIDIVDILEDSKIKIYFILLDIRTIQDHYNQVYPFITHPVLKSKLKQRLIKAYDLIYESLQDFTQLEDITVRDLLRDFTFSELSDRFNSIINSYIELEEYEKCNFFQKYLQLFENNS